MVTASSRLIGRKQEFLKRLASEDLPYLDYGDREQSLELDFHGNF